MRALLIPTIALAMSASSMAFAQTQPSSPQSSDSQKAQQTSTRSYKAVEDSLKQAGIQNVRTLNAAYLVSAVTKDGEQVTFVVDPPAQGGAASSGSSPQSASSGSQQAGASGQSMELRGQQQVRDSLSKAGFTNIKILDAAYLAMGKTQNGDMITMVIDPSANTGSTGATGSGGSGGSGAAGTQPNAGQSGSTAKP